MSASTLLILVVLAVLTIFAARAILRRNKPSRLSGQNIREAWDVYFEKRESWSERDRRAIEFAQTKLSPSTINSLRQRLSETVELVEKDDEPRAGLRARIMDLVDSFVLADALSPEVFDATHPNDRHLSNEYLESFVEAGVLRCYAKLKYDDFATNDWYSHYLGLAEMNARNVVGMIRKTTGGGQATLETSLHEPLSQSMRDAREALLTYPARTPVLPGTKLSSHQPQLADALSEGQIKDLIELMKIRFERLLSGKLYRWPGSPSLSPPGGLTIEAALLHALLSIRFSDPTDTWRVIMKAALGAHQSLMGEEPQFLQRAAEFKEIWLRQQKNQPVSAVLGRAATLVFEAESMTGGSVPVDPETAARRMNEDGTALVEGVRRIVGGF